VCRQPQHEVHASSTREEHVHAPESSRIAHFQRKLCACTDKTQHGHQVSIQSRQSAHAQQEGPLPRSGVDCFMECPGMCYGRPQSDLGRTVTEDALRSVQSWFALPTSLQRTTRNSSNHNGRVHTMAESPRQDSATILLRVSHSTRGSQHASWTHHECLPPARDGQRTSSYLLSTAHASP
jgi:hypothetical protein